MKCPKCNYESELEETYTYYINDDTELQVEEHYWCPECNYLGKRLLTYKLLKEKWIEKNT